MGGSDALKPRPFLLPSLVDGAGVAEHCTFTGDSVAFLGLFMVLCERYCNELACGGRSALAPPASVQLIRPLSGGP